MLCVRAPLYAPLALPSFITRSWVGCIHPPPHPPTSVVVLVRKKTREGFSSPPLAPLLLVCVCGNGVA